MWNPIESWFFKINATENLQARLMSQLAQFAAMGPVTYATQRAKYQAWEDQQSKMLKVQAIYNPVGNVIVSIAAPAYRDYLLRPYDAAALKRLVLLSMEIRRKQVSYSGIPDFMKKHSELSTHPADGSPFIWNPATGEISIHTVAHQRPDRRFSVQIWRRPGN